MSQSALTKSIASSKSTLGIEPTSSIQSLSISLLIIAIWAGSLTYLITRDISNIPTLWLLPAIVVQTFLYTGLFITAHDAMHGVVFPGNIKINNLIGSISVFLYALFSYKRLLKAHWIHHQHPATELDPDFHNGKRKNLLGWYFQFMNKYWSWWRFLGLVSIFNFASFVLHLPERNLTLFWVLPSILSSVQLFYFGTFLPHREPAGGYTNVHCAQSNPLPVLLSFLTCYHFGYHQEHHEYPNVPWWQLPQVYKKVQISSEA